MDIGFVCSVCLSSKTVKAFYFDAFQIDKNLKVKVADYSFRYTLPEMYPVRTNQTADYLDSYSQRTMNLVVRYYKGVCFSFFQH